MLSRVSADGAVECQERDGPRGSQAQVRVLVVALHFNFTMPRATREESNHKRHRSHRSRSPRREDDSHRHKRRSRSPAKPVELPYNAKPLSRRQYDEYRPMFQSYLDIQKQIQLDDLDEREAKGRWKSFVSRWYALLVPKWTNAN